MNIELLNAVCEYLVKSGVELKNTYECKKQVISLVVVTLVEIGMSVQEALDTVCGDGFYEGICNRVYELMA